MWEGKERQIPGFIRQFIEKRKITQKELAERLGVSPVTVNKMLLGNGNIQLSTLFKLCDVLDISPGALLGAPDGTFHVMHYYEQLSERAQDGISVLLKYAVMGEEFERIQWDAASGRDPDGMKREIAEIEDTLDKLKGRLSSLTRES